MEKQQDKDTGQPNKPDWSRYRQQFVDYVRQIFAALQRLYAGIARLWSRFLEVVRKFETKEDLQKAFGHLQPRRIIALAVGLLALLYLPSGVYVVNPGEQAVERFFGRVVEETISEGLHYRLPWPFQQVDKVNVSEVKREGVGLLLPEHLGVHSSPERLQILTGDENIIDVELIIQYRIKDAAKSLFNVDYRPYQLVNELARFAVTDVAGSMQVDDILTIAKEEIQRLLQTEIQSLLDRYQSGLTVITVNINKLYPPDEVADAFRDVASAKEDKARSINQAQGYRNGLIPPARGEAERMIREAEAYQAEVVNKAQGEAQRFLAMLAEYQKTGGSASPDVTLERLYLETMEKILPKVKKYIVNSKDKGKINLRFFGEK